MGPSTQYTIIYVYVDIHICTHTQTHTKTHHLCVYIYICVHTLSSDLQRMWGEERLIKLEIEGLVNEREKSAKGGGGLPPCVNVIVLARLHPSTPQQRLLFSLSSPLGGRWSILLHYGVPGVSPRRTSTGFGRSAGGFVKVPTRICVHRRREPWIGATRETRLNPL